MCNELDLLTRFIFCGQDERRRYAIDSFNQAIMNLEALSPIVKFDPVLYIIADEYSKYVRFVATPPLPLYTHAHNLFLVPWWYADDWQGLARVAKFRRCSFVDVFKCHQENLVS